MDLILCHTTADFDTLGAAVGVARLQPGARIVLAGGMHPTVRDFLALHRDEYGLIERRSVPVEAVRSLTLVDAQTRSRLGKVAEWLDLPDVKVTVYDHHTELDSDIQPDEIYIDDVGAVTTLVVEQLQQQGIIPTEVEATVMALGIHVDTGSLTFDHTTARDARALAWLMEQGASLAAIAHYVDPALSPTLQHLLKIALDTIHTEEVQGYSVAWVLLEVDQFTPGLSSLAAQLMDVMAIDALLLAAQYQRKSGNRDSLSVVGRSRIDGTNLNELFKPLGGGGHPRAASINLHHVDPVATLAQLVQQLKAQLPQPLTARELMSSPVRTIRPDTTIAEAQRILLRYGHSGLSVVDENGSLVGVISRRDLDIALHHGFSHAPVKGYMTSHLHTITPDTLLPEIENLMVTYDIGRLPVLENDRLVGIVTRTDVLRQLHQRGMENSRTQKSSGSSLLPTPYSLLPLLQNRLIPELWELLTIAAQKAEQRGWQLFLVGGAVRDVLLAVMNGDQQESDRRLIEDIDLVVDGFHQAATVGAGVELARSLQTRYLQTRLEIHGKFQTAALLWHNDPIFKSLWVDIATARTEFYPYPAANPEVEASSIQQDLYRRDFTINALAVRLTPPRAGELLDFFGGVLDLQAKRIRVLHANSFIEDPTRIYRAVRFAVRLGFEIEPQTEGYIRHAIASGIYDQVRDRTVPALQTRLKAELKYILQAPYWQAALHSLVNLDALQCIHPSLQADQQLWHELRLAERVMKWGGRGGGEKGAVGRKGANSALSTSTSNLKPQTSNLSSPPPPPWLFRLEVLLAHLASQHRGEIATSFQLPAESIDRLSDLDAAQTQITERLPNCDRPSQVMQVLKQYDSALLILMAIRSDRSIRKTIWRYLVHWSQVKAPLDGKDLQALGYKPGRQFKLMLDDLLAATLDGAVGDRASAETFLVTHYPQMSD